MHTLYLIVIHLDTSEEEVVAMVVDELEEDSSKKEHIPTENDQVIVELEQKLDYIQSKIEAINHEQSKGRVEPAQAAFRQKELFGQFR